MAGKTHSIEVSVRLDCSGVQAGVASVKKSLRDLGGQKVSGAGLRDMASAAEKAGGIRQVSLSYRVFRDEESGTVRQERGQRDRRAV